MQHWAILLVLVLFVIPAVRMTAQRSGSTSLVLRVAPESRLDPRQVTLHFRRSGDGSSDVVTQSATVVASVRALPGQRIRVTASLPNLQGPDGAVPAGNVRWTSSSSTAAGGGRQAACIGGTFSSAFPQDLVQGWGSPGILTCVLNFELGGGLPPGSYFGIVTLAISAE